MSGTKGDGEVGAGSATAREIAQQPDVWREAAGIVRAHREALTAFLQPVLGDPDLRIVLTGAGTSAFVGQTAAPALARRLHRRVDAVATTDLVAAPLDVFAEEVPTLLVSFARSGDSPESLAAVDLADRLLARVHHLVVTCDPAGALARDRSARDGSFVLTAPARANDQGFAMTSSFTSMLLMAQLALLGDDAVDVDALAAAGEQVLAQGDRVQRLVDRDPARFVYLGSGPLTGLARESALKLLEITAGAVDTYWDSSLGFRHGPKAVLDDRTLAVVYRSADPYTAQYDDDIARELRGAIGDDAVQVVRAGGQDGGADWALDGLAGVGDGLLALPYVVLAQLIGLHASVARGIAPDDPFPGGSVNRVVQGVTIHPLDV